MANKLGPVPEFRFDDNPDDKLGVEFKFPGDEFKFGEPAAPQMD